MEPFKKQIPLDHEPARDGKLVAAVTYKALYHLSDDLWFIRYYNTGTHWDGWEVARDKYNSLGAIKR